MSFRTDAVPPEVVRLLERSAGILEPLPGAYLAGGTALALRLGHRVSVDLDFFVAESFLARDLRPRLEAVGAFAPIEVRDDSIVCRVDNVQWSLFRYEYPMLEEPEPWAGVRVASTRDIAAMKVVAIGDRASRKDFYDLYAILGRGGDIRRVLDDVADKFGIAPDGLYHYVKALGYTAEASKTPDIREMLRFETSWSEVEAFFRNLAKRLLG